MTCLILFADDPGPAVITHLALSPGTRMVNWNQLQNALPACDMWSAVELVLNGSLKEGAK